MAHINLNKKSFFNNLDIIAQLTSSKDKIAVVLKDNAYGHGLSFMAPLCQEYGIKKVVVRNQAEALKVKDFFEYILVLADIPDVPVRNAVYTINTIDAVEKFPKNTRVEIKTDSGMHRNGVGIEELEKAFLLCIERGLHIEGVFTHHRSADELSSEFFVQEKNFRKIKEHALALAKKYRIQKLNFHSQNSAALFRAGECLHDMARIGIATYGCLSPDKTLYKGSYAEDLKPVLSLYASKIATRTLKAGERLGYGGIFEVDKETVVSIYDLGYADGLLRKASNNYKTPEGYRLLGRISMDNLFLDTDKEEVCIFNDANSYADSCDTIGYEVLVGMREYIKRSFV
ncbi:alanine racemase [Sulfurimonas sp. HSL-1716]|uniref:alanine racemase n=1 Tax=Hydrocurvibacter sulfurireducens TaxID=3131937 RepID=UPI0031F9ACD3